MASPLQKITPHFYLWRWFWGPVYGDIQDVRLLYRAVEGSGYSGHSALTTLNKE